MGIWKRGVAVLLAIAMCAGIVPVNVFAQAIAPEAGTVLENGSADKQRASDATGSPIEESFIAMTEGQTLSQTVKEKQYYLFAPEESGWYRLRMECPKKGDFFTAGVYQTIYYEGKEQKKKTYREDLYQIRSSCSEYLMWLDKDEKYVFHCSMTGYTDSSDMKAELTMKKAGDWRLETAEPPSVPSDFGFVGTGMKVAFHYGDGTSYTEDVRCTVTDDGEWNRSTSNRLEALKWNEVAVKKGERVSDYLQTLRVDGTEEADFASLSEGSHRAALGVRRSGGGPDTYLELETDFEVSHNPIESISVIRCQDTYEQNMEQSLGQVSIKAVRKDGKTEEFSSNGTYIYQSLPFEETEPDGSGMAYDVTSIDAYLERGGSLGEVDVSVRYQGIETSYPIEIKEYPYNEMSVSPKKQVYYANSGYPDSNGNRNYPGDAVVARDINQVLLQRKEGGTDFYYESGNQFRSLPYSNRLKYGMELNGNSYTDIDTYISDGGSYGEQEVKVSYMDFETSYPVDIRPNPYVRMEIAKPPRVVEYPYDTTRIDLSGLVIYAYKNETEYDTYTYGQNAPEGAAVPTWRDYFRSDPKTEENPYGFKVGEHTVHITFMNMRADFKIRIKEREPDPPKPDEPVYVNMEILKKPARTLYYVKENEHLSNCLSANGLTLALTDSEGVTKKYKYKDDLGQEFSPWAEIEPYINFDWKRIDWSAPGSYTVSVFCQETCAEFDVTIADSPVDSFEILRMPETDTYYFYENKTVSSRGVLRGLAYRMAFDDGGIHAATVRSDYGDDELAFSFQGRTYELNCAWLRSTSNGYASVGENAIVFTLFGKQYQAGPITILENPVESLEVIKGPDDLLCIGQDAKPDLYGAKLKINYTGGRTKEIEVRGHGPSVPVEEDGSAIMAQVRQEWVPGETGGMGYFRRYLQFTYFNQTAQVPADIKPQDLGAAALSDNGQAAAVLDGEHPYQVYSFTPETEGMYSFFCVEKNYRPSSSQYSFHVSFFDGDQSVTELNIGGWSAPMQVMHPLKPGHTYYYIVSRINSGDKTRIPYECYISSEVLYEDQLGEPLVQVADTKKKTWYEYELSSSFWLYPSLKGTTFLFTYANGWTEEKYVSDDISGITVDRKNYNVSWKYLDPETGGMQKPEIRDDNALVYTCDPMAGAGEPGEPYDRVIKEIPIRLNSPNPIESLVIDVNPFEGRYEYALAEGNPAGLVVTAHFKEENRADETFVWDGSAAQEIDGCPLTYDGVFQTGQTGEHGGRVYRLKVSYMDVWKEVLFEAAPNPVMGFEVEEQPQKRTYYPFEQTGHLDLYGMKYAVVYRDGTKEEFSVTEHGSTPQHPEFGKGFRVLYKTKEPEDGVTATELYFSYQGCEQKVTEFEQIPFPADQAAELSDIRPNDMVLGYEEGCRIYKFTSQEAERYQLDVSGNVNFGIYRYDENRKQQDYTDARRSGKRYLGSLEWDMDAGDVVYLVFLSKESQYIGSLHASMSAEAIEKEDLAEISLTVEAPVAGNLLPSVGDGSAEGYRITDSQWYGDADGDGCADFATAHRLMLLLAPKPQYRITEQTKVVLNGTQLTDWVLGADGRLTLYDTFPYTECKISLPDVNGYTLVTDGNEKADRVAYGGTFCFRYLNGEGEPDEALSVKANGNVVELDAQGCYTLNGVTENITITVRADIGDIKPGEDESKVTMHNKSAERYDVMLGKKGQCIQDNPEGENTLPLLPSYENGSDDFFYGWYLGRDDGFNGKGTRFTSKTKLEEDAYELFAKWGSGIFEQRQGKRNAIYRVLSFDESNQMKVEIKGIRRYELYPEAKAAGPRSAKMKTAQDSGSVAGLLRRMEAALKDGGNASGEDEGIMIKIPAALTQDQMQLQEGLELSVEGCEVVAVAEGAFAGEEEIVSVILPETVRQIGAGAFENCKGIEEIQLPSGITKIGGHAFAGCDSLKKIVLPGTLQEAGNGLFADCDGISVVLPDTLEDINSGAFEGAKDLTVICSSKLKESGILDELLKEGITVQVVDLEFGYENGEKIFFYGADEERLTVVDQSRTLLWEYPETDAYTFREEGNALVVTPNRLTTEEDEIYITAIDAQTHAQASLALRTVPADLSQEDGNGAVFDVQVMENPVYTGLKQCPGVRVYRRTGGGSRLDESEYSVSYADNVNAGTGKVTITGKGNYTGSITKSFTIGKAEQEITASDLEKTTDDLVFPLDAKASGNGTLHYSSSNPAVALVDGHGIVMIRGAGTTEIHIWASGTENYQDSALKTVKLVVRQAAIPGPGSIENPDPDDSNDNPPGPSDSGNIRLRLAEDSYTKALGSKPFGIGALANTPIGYSSSNPKVASVNASGRVTVHKCGKAVITVTAGGEQADVSIRVVPKKAKAKATSKKSGELTVSWNRQKEAKGYVVEYSLDKKFKKSAGKKVIKKNKTTSVTLKKLKSGKNYYIRVKAYAVIDGKKAYGAASKAVRIKTKK